MEIAMTPTSFGPSDSYIFDPKKSVLNPNERNSLTSELWKPYPTYKEIYGIEALEQALINLENNGALRQLENGRELINYRSQNTGAKHMFMKNANDLWMDEILVYIEKMRRMKIFSSWASQQKLSVSFLKGQEKSSIDSCDLPKNKHKNGRKKSTEVLPPTDSLTDAFSRTRGIILPEEIPKYLWKTKWFEQYKASHSPPAPPTHLQPLINVDYQGRGDVEKTASDLSQECEAIMMAESHSETVVDDQLANINQDAAYADIYCCDQEDSLGGFEQSAPTQRPPKWHRYRLPSSKFKEETAPKGTAEKRKEASNYVMTDLVNRVRTSDTNERKRVEDQAKMVAERKALMVKIKDQKEKEKQDQTQKEQRAALRRQKNAIALGEKVSGMGIGIPKYTDVDILNAKLSQISLEHAMDLGLRPEMKLVVLRDYIRSKRWDPKEHEQMAKLNDLVDYWTKMSAEQDNIPEARGWKDDNEKALFMNLVDHIKQRQKFAEFDPYKVLHTAYLRLGKDAVKGLEKMCRDMGKDPGIHFHTEDYSVYDKNIFAASDAVLVDEELNSGKGSNTRLPDKKIRQRRLSSQGSFRDMRHIKPTRSTRRRSLLLNSS